MILAKMDANTACIVETNRLLSEIHDSVVDLMDGSDADQERGLYVPASFPNLTSSTTSVTAPTSSPTSAEAADSGFPSGITKLADPPISIDSHLGILVDADGAGVNRLSRLPDSLLCDIVSRLPIKDAARTTVLSRRWSYIERAAPLLADVVDPVVLHLNGMHMLHEFNLSNNHLVGMADHAQEVCWSTISTTSKEATTLGLFQNMALDPKFSTTKLLTTSPTRCSILCLYRYCCLFGFHIQSFRPLPWPPWVFARVFHTWVLLVSPQSLLHPLDESSFSSKSCMDSCCSLTFDPGIMLLSRSMVIFMRLLDGSEDTLDGPCALNLQASASSDIFLDQDANLNILIALPTQHVVCLLYGLSLCDNSQPGMITDQALTAFQLKKGQSRGILAHLKSREEFLPIVELDMLIIFKCLMPHIVMHSSEIKAATVLSLVLFESAIDEIKLLLFQFVQITAQVDESNRRAADPFLSNVCQIWLFTEILVADITMLWTGDFHLLPSFWIFECGGLQPKPPWSAVVSIGPEFQQMPWPPSFKDNGTGIKSEMLPLFLLNFGFSQSALVLMSPRPLSESKLLQLQLYARRVLACATSRCMVSFPHRVSSWDYMEHWFELLAWTIHADVCSRKAISWASPDRNFFVFDIYRSISWVSAVQYRENSVLLWHLKIPWPPHALFQTLSMGFLKNENWKLNLLAESLNCAQIGFIVLVVGDKCRSHGTDLQPRPSLFMFSQYTKVYKARCFNQQVNWECTIYIFEPPTISCYVGLHCHEYSGLVIYALRTPWPPPISWSCWLFKCKFAGCTFISIMRLVKHRQSKKLKPPWLLCSDVFVLCHDLRQQQSPSFKGHCIESKSTHIAGGMFLTLLRAALIEDALLQLFEILYCSALPILWQEPVYTREDTSTSLKLLKGYDIFRLYNGGLQWDPVEAPSISDSAHLLHTLSSGTAWGQAVF